jgi:hypothetical protein
MFLEHVCKHSILHAEEKWKHVCPVQIHYTADRIPQLIQDQLCCSLWRQLEIGTVLLQPIGQGHSNEPGLLVAKVMDTCFSTQPLPHCGI